MDAVVSKNLVVTGLGVVIRDNCSKFDVCNSLFVNANYKPVIAKIDVVKEGLLLANQIGSIIFFWCVFETKP